jgi:hypothetical protein
MKPLLFWLKLSVFSVSIHVSMVTISYAQSQADTAQQQNTALLQAIDQRLKIMQEIAKRFEANIEKLNIKPKPAEKPPQALNQVNAKQNKTTFLQAIDKRIATMRRLDKSIAAGVAKLTAKTRNERPTTITKSDSTLPLVRAVGGVGRWGNDKLPYLVRPDYPKTQPPSMGKCKHKTLSKSGLSPYISCIR